MKATLWLCSIVTTMLTQSIYAAPLINYQYSYSPKSLYKENMLTEMKRTKPSLSIVNPLDVLRQRLLLEIARRQMRENSKQVEKNRMYLKTVGKRAGGLELDDDDGSEMGDWQNFRYPPVKSPVQAWPMIHRSAAAHHPLPSFDVYRAMNHLRNQRPDFEGISSNSVDNRDVEMNPNRTLAEQEGPSVSLQADEYDEDNNKSTGLNI